MIEYWENYKLYILLMKLIFLFISESYTKLDGSTKEKAMLILPQTQRTRITHTFIRITLNYIMQ